MSNPLEVYLAGGIQKAPDQGRKWREEMIQWAKDNGITEIIFKNPLDLKENKKNDDTLLYTDDVKWAENMDKIYEGDTDLIKECDAMLTFYDKYAGDGTNKEIALASELGRAHIFIRTIKKTSVPHWVMKDLIQSREKGSCLHFGSLEEIKDYLLILHNRGELAETIKRLNKK